jgi:pseudouridine 5'-phosphatase
MNRNTEAAIFDLDGVLLDTEPLYTLATQTVVAQYGKHYAPQHKRFVMGRADIEGAQWLVENLNLPITAEQYLEARRGHLESLFGECPCVLGAESLVGNLRSRGIRLALATSSARSLYQLKVRKHRWFDAFEFVVCGDDPRLQRSKPAPDIFLLASAALNVEPSRCLVFEDSAAGVQAGVTAGMRVIALLQPPVTSTDVAKADQIVSNYAELDLDRLLEAISTSPRSGPSTIPRRHSR